MVQAWVDNPNQLWTSSGGKHHLRKADLEISRPVDGREQVDVDSDKPPSYHELSTISQAEWREAERSGVRSSIVGREEAMRHVAKKATAKGRQKRQAPLAQEAPTTEGGIAQEAMEVPEDPVEPKQDRPTTWDEEPPQEIPRDGLVSDQGEQEEVPLERGEQEEAPSEIDPTQRVVEIVEEDLGDTPMEDAPEVQQEAPYLFRRERRYPPRS
ncbi:hypothetical protein N7447_004667 [Penicillium robsamsonii]|uniref:uncharacterized protein n=1 Tax=Penicillium robsamsonii TaxID=1792511 RepID=UPI002546D800|nr:uncharacterized protein N7447_004667 [Penicillium robsamsonii]KAJ5827904.1 hypothetical protein N7447_004667 [Penicillium robsamsonii]